ncbi:DUF6333 family protein [Kitasatospora sp. NBC_00240]|uniref:DUF6333 family protein n=1 Tax=Kitasatospora sp. NBC_00240 TaxID=2903567 RepID=UPI00224D3838|nr:DUF6333 family protein [Kitasatospora sp. NBC_00240]MCX5209911.1 DUF6333 family protein [Kitasatospora sp. NBC_00240]
MSPNQQVAWRQSVIQITRVHPPCPAPFDHHAARRAPAHDPVRARAVVAALPTVATVAEELDPVRRRDLGHPNHLEDLDLVTVGCWGGIVQISDPAFGEDGILSTNLDNAFQAQVKAHPEARITAVCEMYSAETYGKYLAHVPGQPDLAVDGWDEQFVTGDPARLLRAVGANSGAPGAECLDPDQEEPYLGLEYLNLITCNLHSVWANERLMVSVFRVTRTEDVRYDIAEAWLRD